VREEAARRAQVEPPPCVSGLHRFHIDAYGGLQLCSGNRGQSYDLRHGSFQDGFYRHLPTFGCRWKEPAAAAPSPRPVVIHA
jgi:hypothetical protein